ncbi:MAG: glycoside hydrolase family 99-like domain-containing protein, partial [Agrococcus sp.]
MTEATNDPASERSQIVELQQELARARRELQAAEDLAARPDPWDPKVWVGRARRIGGMGRRFAQRTIRRSGSPKVIEPAASTAPSSFEGWSRRMQGSRFVGFPVDWRFSRRGPETHAPIAVVLHCHFIELLDELVQSLSSIPEPFDLYVTNSSGEVISPDRLAVDGAQHVEVLTVENHGRDIWPLVQVINAGILDPYDVVLKVHTKKSAWREEHPELAGDGATWRSSLTSALLGSAGNVEEILAAMRADRDIAAVTADGSVVGPEHWGGDLDLVRGVYRRLSLPLDPDALRFPAGSMYWVRGFVLQGLRAFRFDRDDFEPESGQIDGTCAHAIERMVGLLSTEAGMRVLERREVAAPAAGAAQASARIVPFYLPQFHQVPENDKWWGKGFTEWYNVVKAVPIYDGHVVPLRPTELGYYSLELDSVRRQQRELSRAHGIDAFMYYYYWFAGKKLLERPIEALLESDLDQPFCIMWANENFTRTWDG